MSLGLHLWHKPLLGDKGAIPLGTLLGGGLQCNTTGFACGHFIPHLDHARVLLDRQCRRVDTRKEQSQSSHTCHSGGLFGKNKRKMNRFRPWHQDTVQEICSGEPTMSQKPHLMNVNDWALLPDYPQVKFQKECFWNLPWWREFIMLQAVLYMGVCSDGFLVKSWVLLDVSLEGSFLFGCLASSPAKILRGLQVHFSFASVMNEVCPPKQIYFSSELTGMLRQLV